MGTDRVLILIIMVAGLFAASAAFLLGQAVPATEQEVQYQAAAVTEDGQGVLVPFSIAMRPGTGRILVDIQNAIYREDVEQSLRYARNAAGKIAGSSLASYDVEFAFGDREVGVGGGSAGMAFTAAMAAAFQGRKLNPLAVASATIQPDGTLGPVAGAGEKIFAAQQDGKTLFLLSIGQRVENEAELSKRIRIVRAATAAEAYPYLVQ
ncbi:hypothetical protein HY995_02735 [Candidatus Micrarchaeota archaeon]|nr:hypothetical protein [Candidatus Micrarchaeota archaeon]MBI5176979.1 hypothetical protein [Candidatus Micrarchaeota archaeon]